MKPKYRYHEFYFSNRWKRPFYSRDSTWTYLGIGQRWFGPNEMAIRISFFGLEFSFWFIGH
jgi:hypothetical protein